MKTVWILLCLGMAEIISFAFLRIFFKKRKSRRRLVVFVMVVFPLLLVLTLALAIVPPGMEVKTTGSHEIASEDYWIKIDGANQFEADGSYRELQIRKWYPVDAKEGVSDLPIVVASHGSCGTIDSNLSLYQELASNGYVVLAIGHPGHAATVTLSNGKNELVSSEFLSELRKINPQSDPDESYEIFKKWMDIRITDIDAVISDYKNKHGSEKFIAVGHSLGGAAAYGIARKRNDIAAVIALESPFLADITGVSNGEYVFNFDEYNIPLMNVYSDSSYASLPDWLQYGENIHLLDSKDEKIVNVYYKGVSHMGLCDLSLKSPLFAALIDGRISEVDAREQLSLLNRDVINFLSTIQ